MEKIPKIKEYSKKEIKRQFTNGEIDTDFMCEYISIRDKVYNQLVDEVNDLKEKNKKLRIQASSREEVANKYKYVIEEARKYVEYYHNQIGKVSEFDIMANPKILLQILDKGADK